MVQEGLQQNILFGADIVLNGIKNPLGVLLDLSRE